MTVHAKHPDNTPAVVTQILDWVPASESDNPQDLHTAMLMCLAKVYDYVRANQARESPSMSWGQAMAQLPLVTPAGLLNNTSNPPGPQVQTSLVQAVLAGAGMSNADPSQVADILGPHPTPGTVNVVQTNAVSSATPTICQVVASLGSPSQGSPPTAAWQLSIATRSFVFDWRTLSNDAGIRAQWNRFMDGISAGVITALPNYHRIAART